MPSRAALFVALAAAVSGLAACSKAKPGDACERGATVCFDARTELSCEGNRFVASPCKGPSGCAVHSGKVACDVSANAEGDVCAVTDEGKGACASDGKSQVVCRSGSWQRTRCLGPEGCKPTGTGSSCDTSIAEEGDRCVSGDACSPDHARLLTCIGGRYVMRFACRGKNGCADKGHEQLSCDLSAGQIGDACAAGGACSVDGKQLLACKGGKLALDRQCRGDAGCKDDGSGNLKCDMSVAETADECSDGAACSVDRTRLLVCEGGRFIYGRTCPCVVTGDSVGCAGRGPAR